jgi:integrase
VSWQAKIRIRGRWRTGTFKREKDAKAALLRWQTEDEAAPRRPETLGDYLAHWLETVKRHQVRPSTYRSYRWQVRTQIVPILGRLLLADVTSTDIQRWESAEMDRPRQTDGGKRSARMVRYSHSLLAQALKHAHAAGLIAKNPMEGVTPPRRDARDHRTWEPWEVERFLLAAEGKTYSPIWLIALTTGMRIGELLALRWQDVDLEAGTIAVERGMVLAEEGYDTQAPKSAAGVRLITLGGPSIHALRAHRLRQIEQQLRKGAAWKDLGLVFASEVGTTLSNTNVRRVFLAIQQESGLQRIRFHDLRHSNATIAVEAGVPVNTVSARLGHADVRTTLSIYVRPTRTAEQAAAATIEALIAGNKRSS